MYQHPSRQKTYDDLKLQIQEFQSLVLHKVSLKPQKIVTSPLLEPRYGILTQTPGELKCKLPGGRKIKISVDIRLGHLRRLNHRKPCLSFGQ